MKTLFACLVGFNLVLSAAANAAEFHGGMAPILDEPKYRNCAEALFSFDENMYPKTHSAGVRCAHQEDYYDCKMLVKRAPKKICGFSVDSGQGTICNQTGFIGSRKVYTKDAPGLFADAVRIRYEGYKEYLNHHKKNARNYCDEQEKADKPPYTKLDKVVLPGNLQNTIKACAFLKVEKPNEAGDLGHLETELLKQAQEVAKVRPNPGRCPHENKNKKASSPTVSDSANGNGSGTNAQ